MKWLISAFAAILAWPSAVCGAPPAPLTSLQTISTVSNAQASLHPPVVFQATVTYFRSYERAMFVQDGNTAIYLHVTNQHNWVPGDRVLVRGSMRDSFRPYVETNDITLVGHGALPKPISASFDQMIRGETDCKLVTTHAIIRSVDLVPDPNSPVTFIVLEMLVDGSQVDANVDSDDESAVKDLFDAEVEITGVASGHFDNKMQQTGVLFHVQSLSGIKVLKHAANDPWSIPVAPMDRIITGYRAQDLSQRMRVEGTVTYNQPGSGLVLQDGDRSLWIATQNFSPIQVGDRASAIGFPEVQNGFLSLIRSEVRDTGAHSPVTPALLSWETLATGGNKGRSHIFDLVSIEGQVVADVRQATQDEYVLQDGGHLFSAILRHPSPSSRMPLLPMKHVPVGSRIRVTGICMLADANPFYGDVPFNILVRSFDDIQVVAQPSLLTVKNMLIVAGLLLVVLIVVGVRGWILERNVRRQTASIAYLERLRRRILEDINGDRPLAEIIEQITEVVTFRRQGAPCWCEITDGARLGNWSVDLSPLKIVQKTISGRSGAPLGTLFAAFPPHSKPASEDTEALAMGAGLAALAIETRRLYQDLLRRSEFDLLTDIQNRFSLEKELDAHIDEARKTAGIFGLIYIDLDDFKLVNDRYGHHVGDLYLQEAAARMKHQLRPADILARLGGDEFAVLVPVARSRYEVQEIASRLERCIDEPFVIDGHLLCGSASIGIALYPEDATNKDSLLCVADADMYKAKKQRKEKGHHEDHPALI